MTRGRTKRRRVVLLLIAVVLLLTGGAFLAIHRLREHASRVYCAENLREIGQALLLYAQAHKGAWPARLENVATPEDMNTVVLKCVVTERPFIFLRPGGNAAAFGEHDVLVYEPPEYHDHHGANALFGDGHVEWLAPDELRRAIQRPTSHPATTRAAR